jgi:ceramide glucosyltransferase
MAPLARHGAWLLTDSEAELDKTFVEAFRREWSALGVDILTAGYRFSHLRTWPQILDAAPAQLTLWPGLMLAPRIDFTLGACTAIHSEAVQSLGGWESLGDQLAEDRELGARLAAKGKTIALSRHLLTLEADEIGWWSWLKHQHRIAVTYRAATPLGTLGMPILHAVGLATLAAILALLSGNTIGAMSAVALLATVLTLRFIAAKKIANLLETRIGLLEILIVPVIETVCWLLAWLPIPVWWAGKWRPVHWRGQLE